MTKVNMSSARRNINITRDELMDHMGGYPIPCHVGRMEQEEEEDSLSVPWLWHDMLYNAVAW